MVRIDFFVFGYRILKCSTEELSYVAGVLLREKIPSVVKNNGSVYIREKDYLRVSKLFADREGFVFSECLGVHGALKRIRHKRTLAVASLISMILVLLSSSLVWDIRVEGNARIPDATVTEGLERSGFSVGKFWGRLDLSRIETDYLKNSGEISWININRRGTVAYVTVIENEITDAKGELTKSGYANIVASRDSVIEEITVKNGVAVVSVGDSVKKGDLLICGVNSSEFGSDYCYAEGTVIGRVKDSISVLTPREYTKTEKTDEKICSLRINFFNFKINIFNTYGNIGEKCDIIKEIRTYSLFGKAKLPIEVYTERCTVYETAEMLYSDTELIRVTTNVFERKLWERLRGADLLKLKTEGGFTDNGYNMRCDAVYLTEIGEPLPFSGE